MRIHDTPPDDLGGLPGLDDQIVAMLETALTLADVADRLNVSPRHVQELVDRGELVASDIGLGEVRQRLRVTEADLVGYLIRKRVSARKVAAFEDPQTRPTPLAAKPSFIERRAAKKARRSY